MHRVIFNNARSFSQKRLQLQCAACGPELASLDLKRPPYSVKNTSPPMIKLMVYLSGDDDTNGWSKKLELTDRVMKSLGDVKRGSGVGVLYTSLEPSQKSMDEFIIYPSGIRVCVPNQEGELSKFFGSLMQGEDLGDYFREKVTKPVVLTCSHQKRDERCGILGPMIDQEFKAQYDSQLVGMCSHVGGHVYAGNVLICKPERVDWYGMVRPQDVSKIVEKCVNNNETLDELHRGVNCQN